MISCILRRHNADIITQHKFSAECKRGEGITIIDMISHETLRKVLQFG